MPKMKAAMAAVLVMEREGVTQAFGVPGANSSYRPRTASARGPVARTMVRIDKESCDAQDESRDGGSAGDGT